MKTARILVFLAILGLAIAPAAGCGGTPAADDGGSSVRDTDPGGATDDGTAEADPGADDPAADDPGADDPDAADPDADDPVIEDPDAGEQDVPSDPPVVPDDASPAGRKAMEAMDDIGDDIAALNELSGRVQELASEARSAYMQGDNERAAELTQERTELMDKGRALEQEIRTDLAALEEDTTAALEENAGDWALLEVRGMTRLNMGETRRGAADLVASLEAKPGRLDTARVASQALFQSNQFEAAAGQLEAILEQRPDDAQVLMSLATCRFAVHDFAGARKIFEDLTTRSEEDLPAEQRRMCEQYVDWSTMKEEQWQHEQELRAAEAEADDLPRVRLTTEAGEIVIELFENEAPNHTANFITLVEDGYYDGTRFHRVIPDFMAQGGCPNTKDGPENTWGQGGPGWKIADECKEEPYRKHFRGTLSMANAGPDTNGSQFFLTHLPTPWLDGRHTVFGRVLSGQDVVDAMEAGTVLTKAEVLRKRDHDYEVEKLPE